MPTSQCDQHTVHCVLGSVSSNSHNSMFPTSRIMCFDSGLKGLHDWLCCWSLWRACRFGWFSIFWINSRTLALCNCFTIECGSLGMLKCMCPSILSRSVSLSVLSILASWCTSGSSCTATVCLSGCLGLSWVCSTLTFLFSSGGRVWALITFCVLSSCLDLSEEQFFVERFHTDFLRTGRFTFNNYHVLRDFKWPWSISDWLWDWFGWLEEFCLSSNFSSWPSSNFSFWLLINCRAQWNFTSSPIVT